MRQNKFPTGRLLQKKFEVLVTSSGFNFCLHTVFLRLPHYPNTNPTLGTEGSLPASADGTVIEISKKLSKVIKHLRS